MKKYSDLYNLYKKVDENEILNKIIKYLEFNKIDDIDENDNTLLLCAISQKRNVIVEYLIDNGANVNGNRKTRYYPLEMAVLSNNIDAITLLEKTNKLKYNRKNDLSIDYACAMGLYSIVEKLIIKGSLFNEAKYNDMFPIHWACQEGKIDVIKLLLQKGADINAMDESGQTSLYKAASENNKEIVEYLLNNGADVDLTKDTTPLMIAYSFKCYDVIPLLLNSGANVNFRDNDGRTSLFYAKVQKDAKKIKILKENGASMEVVDNFGISIKDLEDEEIRKKLYNELFM